MTLELQMPALVFPVVSLLFIALRTGFLGLTSVSRTLMDRYKADPTSQLEAQITNLMIRINLIRIIQLLAVLSICFATASMIAIFNQIDWAATKLFVASLAVLLAAFGLCVVETYISVDAIKIEFRQAKLCAAKKRES